jgi:hypothetical protein
LFAVFLQTVYAFHFFNIEQYQLFLFDGEWIMDTFATVGGLSRLLADFLLQFFIYPFAGTFLTSLLLTLVGVLTYRLLKRVDKASVFIQFFALLPVCSLLFLHTDFNYFMQGTVSYLFTLLLLNGYMRLNRMWLRLAYASVWMVVLFWFCGSVAVLFAVTVFVKEVFEAPRTGFWFLLPVSEVLLMAWMSVRFALVGDYAFAFLPDMYFHALLKPGRILYFSWIILPVTIAILYVLRTKKALSGRKRKFCRLVLWLACGVLFVCYNQVDESSLKYKKMEYYYRTKQYDQVIEMNKNGVTNLLYGCLLNLALAEKGELAERIFTFEQNGPHSLLIPADDTYMISALLSDIHYAIGHTGASMHMAFEANTCSIGRRSGRMIRRLVETNLIYGHYAVAEKYIALLEKSFHYRKWAGEMRRYLYDDDAVGRNPEFDKRRKSLPQTDILFTAEVKERELTALAASNPENRNPIEYLGSMYLLAKDLNRFEKLLKTHYQTPVLPILPLSFQEATVILNEANPSSWKAQGVSQPVITRFEQYRKFILDHKNNPRLEDFVKKSFGQTYWYYYMFKNRRQPSSPSNN